MSETTLVRDTKRKNHNQTATVIARKRYDRVSQFYNLMEMMMEKQHTPWRQQLWSLVQGEKVLEIGVGTGKNLEYYPSDKEMTAIDFSQGMLAHAQKRSRELGVAVDLHQDDAQDLDFPSHSFDAVVATCVFCSVPDPVLGLREAARVLKPGGKIYLLEHMRSPNRIPGRIMDALNPLVVRLIGANINRRTEDNIKAAGLTIESQTWLDKMGIFRLLVVISEP